MGYFIALLALAAVPAYPAVQLKALRTMRGGWFYAAIAPLVLMIPILVFTIVAFRQDSNLWPILLILAAPVAVLYLVVVRGLYEMID